MYCEVFLIFITQLYQSLGSFFLFAILNDEPEVFLPEYSHTTILQAAHFWRVVNLGKGRNVHRNMIIIANHCTFDSDFLAVS